MSLDTPLEGAGTTGSIASREQLPDRFGSKIHSSDSKVKPTSAKNPENSSTDSAFSLSADSSYADRMAEIKAEMQQLKKKYEGTDQWMKAPNGKPTNLTEFQWLQVRTKAFKEWFGDWENDPENASKVVDENGEPLVVYNVGKSGISIFDIEQTGKSNEFAKVGFWFSDEKSLADSFAKNWYNQTWNGKEYAPGNVYAVYLNIKNPKIYELELTHKMLQGVLRNYHDFSQVN